MKVTKSDPLSLVEAKELLDKRKEEGELNYEQTLALEHAEKFATLTVKKAREKVEAIQKKSDKVPESTAVKLVDVMPKSAATLKAVLLRDKVELTDDEIGEILKIIG
ncbi:MAG: RNA polymerase Rpb4 family protein [Candidatus Micrarchaeota archaeon]